MKKKLFNISLAAILTLGLAFTSCSQATEEPLLLTPAKAPEFTISSGHGANQKFFTSDTKAGSINTDFSYHKIWDGDFPAEYKSKIPAEIQQEEKTFVLNWIKENSDKGGIEFNCSIYFIQNIGSSYNSYGTKDHNGASHTMTGGNHMDYLVINGKHINDYNASWGPTALVKNLACTDPTYHDSYGNNTWHDSYRFFSIPDRGYYLGFDYRTEKNGDEKLAGDGIYNDWVVKLVPADGNNPIPAPVTPTPEQPVIDPIVDNLVVNDGEVEANLSINDEKSIDDYVATKLSVHVRDTCDFDVLISIPAEKYCQQDDVAVVLSHKLIEEYYLTTQSREIEINGNKITFSVVYEAEGIRVRTSGINSDVIKYCRTNFADGLTFEVWNYYRNITREETKTALDKSKITFSTKNPEKYINAFGPVASAKNQDCRILPSSDFKLVSGGNNETRVYARK